MVGLTEAQARERHGGAVVVRISHEPGREDTVVVLGPGAVHERILGLDDEQRVAIVPDERAVSPRVHRLDGLEERIGQIHDVPRPGPPEIVALDIAPLVREQRTVDAVAIHLPQKPRRERLRVRLVGKGA